jgi:hypothetical protein
MATSKPRYTITDTGDLSDQLDRAQRRWPESRDRMKLAAAGRDAIEEETDRARAVEETAGTLSGVSSTEIWSDCAKTGLSDLLAANLAASP